MDYQQAWKFLDNLQFFKIKLGLDSMRTFLGRLGRPDERLRFVHLAGTNGKGSVGAMLHAILNRAGYKTAFYTSPHLSSVRERFRIGDQYISEDDFALHASAIVEVLGEERITYFEFTTALALLWFAAEKVDLVVLETGLGGRLDATNVITPLVSVITNVAMDHEAYLGDTVEAVASEKAGIIKSGVPVVSGVDDPSAAWVIEDFCREKGAPLFRLGHEFRATESGGGGWDFNGWRHSRPGLPMNLLGRHQILNGGIALAVLECLTDLGICVDEEPIRSGLASVTWPARLESFSVVGPVCGIVAGEERRGLIDGAHNPAGSQALALALKQGFPRRRLFVVWASMADKDIGSTLGEIVPMADEIILTRPEYERSASPREIAAFLADFKGEVHLADEVESALKLAFSKASDEDLVLVAGSLYLAGKARVIMLGGLV